VTILPPRPKRRDEMGKIINCECGRVVSGDTDEELISRV
jgi:hypothetical protein